MDFKQENIKKVGVLVVTFNRLDYLKKYMEAIKKLKAPEQIQIKTYVIDNASTDGTKEWLDQQSFENTVIYHLPENTGGSGGFSFGVKTAIEDGCDYVWGMDDDAFPSSKSLIEIFKTKKILGENACYWSNCDKDDDFSGPYKLVNKWMFVGFFIPKNIVKEIGYPCDDYFIFFDDIEYSNRVQKYGYKIYKVRDSYIEHSDSFSKKIEGHFFQKHIDIPAYPDWKLYYFMRNDLLMYSKTESGYWKNAWVKHPKFFIKLLILDKKQFKVAFKGHWDGITRKRGKVMAP